MSTLGGLHPGDQVLVPCHGIRTVTAVEPLPVRTDTIRVRLGEQLALVGSANEHITRIATP